MVYGDNRTGGGGFGAPRQMVDVSAMGLTCADCGVAITELPFNPTAGKPVWCRDCNRKRRANFGPRRF